MDPRIEWLLAGLVVCLLVGGLVYGRRRAERNRRLAREQLEARQRAEAQRASAEKAARQQEARRAAAAAEEAARAAEDRRTQAEAAARLRSERLAAEEATRARVAAAHAAEAQALEAARRLAEEQARAAAAAVTPPVAEPPAAKTRAQTLVLVADDSKIVRVKTGRLLTQNEYRVSYATDGLDAANQLLTDPPDIVITDVEMPGMDGFELTRRVREDPRTAHIPVIMITAAEERHRDDAMRAGVSIVLGKPYPEEELIAHIRRAMNH